MQRQYIPFYEVKNRYALIVDSLHPYGLALSHWRGAPTPASLRDDTSAGSVLRALKQEYPGLEAKWVTANHFDIDGFVGVWSLLHPQLALENEALLREMAVIGDFRELDLTKPVAHKALQLVCWINGAEKALFYPPFGADDLEDSEVKLSPPKFDYFLEKFATLLNDPELGRAYWQSEYERVLEDYQLVHSEQTKAIFQPAIGLVILEVPRPVHYYALFSRTRGYDIVLSMYAGNRYELEYKYTTWVDLASRPTLPRLPLQPLGRLLTELETNDGQWKAEPVTDTGPILRLESQALDKMQRYANPYERVVSPSSIAPSSIQKMVSTFFTENYSGILPKKYWSWPEVKALRSK